MQSATMVTDRHEMKTVLLQSLNTMHCDCGQKHRRYKTKRDRNEARWCKRCAAFHSVREVIPFCLFPILYSFAASIWSIAFCTERTGVGGGTEIANPTFSGFLIRDHSELGTVSAW